MVVFSVSRLIPSSLEMQLALRSLHALVAVAGLPVSCLRGPRCSGSRSASEINRLQPQVNQWLGVLQASAC